ncbi:hypothetical protein CAPTEDRAFT_118871, partial [Capitella teleta]
GTTWTGEILRYMREYHADFKPNNKKEETYIPYIEFGFPGVETAIEGMDTLPAPRVMKTHLYYEYFQQKVEEENLKVIVVLREPRDTLTSYYDHYCQDAIGFPGDFHQFFELVRQDKLVSGNIFQMARDWWTKRHLPNVHVVKYEEMKEDCSSVIRGISEFLEIPLEAEHRQQLLAKCSFDNMRKTSSISEMKGENEKFFRKGIIGDWRNHMTQDEAEFVADCVREFYNPVGLNFYV